MNKKNLTTLVFCLFLPLQAMADNDYITARVAELLFDIMESEYNRHPLPKSSYGIYYEPVDGMIARTHCPILETITVYNKHGRKRQYLVRDCRR